MLNPRSNYILGNSLAVTLPIPSRRMNMTCIYRAPDADQEEDAILLNVLTSEVKETNKSHIVGGFKLPYITWVFET